MHLNYFFLKKLSVRLQEKLTGCTLAACFSQEKDELVFGFTNGAEDLYIKAILTSSFSALSFQKEFHRKRQNSVDLFAETVGKTVIKVVQHKNERSFYLELAGGNVLLFKMFGNRSNVILYQNNEPVSRFHQKFPDDFNLDPRTMDREIEIPSGSFPLSLKDLQGHFPVLGDLVLAFLAEKGFEEKNEIGQEALLATVLQQLEENPDYCLVTFKDKLRLSMVPIGEQVTCYPDPLEAAQHFAAKFLADRYYQANFNLMMQHLERQKLAAEQSLSQVENKLRSLQTEASYSQTADIIMANLTNIPARAKEVLLYDFYQDSERTIKLKSTETPQKTAERLYKKGKNQQIEVQILEEKALRKTGEIITLEVKIKELLQITGARELKMYLKSNQELAKPKTNQSESPFREFMAEGFRIFVGKSAKNNDELTQKVAFKEDLWLHAKDVSGSHVLIKYQSGKTFPTTVIEKAAQLAAFYSKRKTDSLCPVIYTPKKFVRKPKGAAPGSVVVEREKVILVKPGNPFERQFD